MGKAKLVDTWYYDVKDLEVFDLPKARDDDESEPEQGKRIITKKVEVEVRMEKDTEDAGGPPYALKKVQFIVACREPKFNYAGTDIEALRTAAFGHLDKRFTIEWENYFLVTVEPERNFSGGYSTGLSFSYKDIEKGMAWNGQTLLREYEWRGGRVIKPWPGRFKDKNGKAIACIPASKTNKAALEEFSRRIDTLRDMIRDTLRPEEIVRTLQNLSGLLLLPPAQPGHDDDEKR